MASETVTALANANQATILIKELPSKFLPYSFKSIRVRSLTFGEMSTLSSDDLTDQEYADILNPTILTGGAKIEDLARADAKHLISYISLFTDPKKKWQFRSDCKTVKLDSGEMCNGKVTKLITAQNFFEISDYTGDGYPLYVTLDNGAKLKFGFPTYANAIWITTLESKGKAFDASIAYLATFLKGVDDRDLTEDAAYDYIFGISDPDFPLIMEEICKILTLDYKPIELKCPICGETHKYPVELEVSTIVPFQEDKRDIRDRISFGKRV